VAPRARRSKVTMPLLRRAPSRTPPGAVTLLAGGLLRPNRDRRLSARAVLARLPRVLRASLAADAS
jgi:hypothetical protein